MSSISDITKIKEINTQIGVLCNVSEEGMMPVEEFALKCCANLFVADNSISVNDYLSIDISLVLKNQ